VARLTKNIQLLACASAIFALLTGAEANADALDRLGASTSSAADKIVIDAESLLRSVSDVHYEHLHAPASDQVTGNTAHNDCSGFVSYLLAKHAPAQYAAISSKQPQKEYPQAKTYAKFFTELESTRAGWKKVLNINHVKRGDYIAWAKQIVPGQKSGNTGHVAIVAAPPGDVRETTVNDKRVLYVEIKVIDSSSVDHFAPDLLPPNAGQKHRDGIGEGYVRIIVDTDHKPVGYWEGTFWNEGGKPISGPSYTPIIGFARLVN